MQDAIFSTPLPEENLRDESGMTGYGDAIVFPRDTAQLQAVIKQVCTDRRILTVQGARTGICGGAVPLGGSVVNLSAMTDIEGFFFDVQTNRAHISLQAGVTLEHLNQRLLSKKLDTCCFDRKSLACWEAYRQSEVTLRFAPNPTETSATVGGMAAANAIGSHIYAGVDMRTQVLAVEVVMPNGIVACASRLEGESPPLPMDYFGNTVDLSVHPQCGNCAGYNTEGDLIDFICGSEGTSGVISRLTLALAPVPPSTCGLLAFFDTPAQMILFLADMEQKAEQVADGRIVGADFFEASCFRFIRRMRSSVSALCALPDFSTGVSVSLWLEIAAQNEDVIFALLEDSLECLKNVGAPADLALVATDSREFSRLQGLRHGITEAANLFSYEKKVFTMDINVPKYEYSALIARLSVEMRQHPFECVLMGRAGTGHLSFRLMPETGAQQVLAEQVHRRWMRQFTDLRCECACEYGVGRLKRELFETLCPSRAAATKRIRSALDPAGLFSPGVLCDS